MIARVSVSWVQANSVLDTETEFIDFNLISEYEMLPYYNKQTLPSFLKLPILPIGWTSKNQVDLESQLDDSSPFILFRGLQNLITNFAISYPL